MVVTSWGGGVKPGVNYEIGLNIDESKILWVAGPTPAGVNDIAVVRSNLKCKIPTGKGVIADQGYKGKPELIINRKF
jgi:hypothetical protein